MPPASCCPACPVTARPRDARAGTARSDVARGDGMRHARGLHARGEPPRGRRGWSRPDSSSRRTIRQRWASSMRWLHSPDPAAPWERRPARASSALYVGSPRAAMPRGSTGGQRRVERNGMSTWHFITSEVPARRRRRQRLHRPAGTGTGRGRRRRPRLVSRRPRQRARRDRARRTRALGRANCGAWTEARRVPRSPPPARPVGADGFGYRR